MKFSIRSGELARTLGACSKVTPKKVVLDILSNVCITKCGKDSFQMKACDNENELKIAVEINTLDDKWLDFCVNPSILLQGISTLSNETLMCELVDGKLKVDYGYGDFTVPVLPADEWPVMPDLKEDEVCSMEIEASKMLPVIKNARSCAGKDDVMRPVMSHTLVDTDSANGCLTVVASDGHKLYSYAMQDLGAGFVAGAGIQAYQFLLSPCVCSVLQSIVGDDDTLYISQDSQRTLISTTSMRLVAKKIDMKFPNWRSIIPSFERNNLVAVLSKNALQMALKRVSPFCSGSELLKLEFANGNLLVQCEDIDMARCAQEKLNIIDGNLAGSSLKIGVKASSLALLLQSVSTDNVCMYFSDASSAILLKEHDEKSGLLLLLMPMLLNS